jgi:GTPase SAR1 family protein
MDDLCVLLVIGEAGQGKSTLIGHFFESTGKKDRERIQAMVPRVVLMDELPQCGDDAGGVTKDPALYPVRVGGRDVILIDMPGMQAGSATAAKPAELLAWFLSILKQSYLQLNGVLSCVKVGNRLTMGQDFCQQLIAKCGGGKAWNQILLVGTKKDTYYCGKKIQKQKCEDWQKSIVATVNSDLLTEGVALNKCILTNICVDEEEDDDTDVDALTHEIKNFSGMLHYRPVGNNDIADMMNSTFGTKLITEDDVQHAHDMDPLEQTVQTAAGLAGGAALGVAAVGAAGAASSATFAGVCAAAAALAGGTITATGSVAIVAAPFVALAGGVYLARKVSTSVAGGDFGSVAQSSHKEASDFLAANGGKEAAEFATNRLNGASVLAEEAAEFAANRRREAAEIAANRWKEAAAIANKRQNDASNLFKSFWG